MRVLVWHKNNQTLGNFHGFGEVFTLERTYEKQNEAYDHKNEVDNFALEVLFMEEESSECEGDNDA